VLVPAWLLVIGFGVGTIGTLVGAGGGFLLVPLLALLAPALPAESVTAMSLVAVAMNAASGTIAYARQGRVDFRSGIVFAIATIPGSIGGALLTRVVSREAFDAIFAAMLIGLAAFLVLAREDEPGDEPEGGGWGHVLRELTDRSGTDYRYRLSMPLGVLISLGVGLISSFLGIGGGVIHVPALVGLLHFPPHVATATSTFVLAITATSGALTHVAAGDLGSLGPPAAVLGLGAVAGAQVGARISHRVHGLVIIRALAACLVFVGARLAYQAVLGG
jgi:uncharacterized membrane protein YfcA